MKRLIKKNIAGFCLASFFNDWCHEIGTALLPAIVTQLVGALYAPAILGIIQGFSDAAATGMRLLSGYLADRVTFYKPIVILGYGLTGIFSPLIGIAQSVWAVFFYKIIAWMSRGLREPIRDAWISRIVSPGIYGLIFGLHRAFDTLGSLIAPLSVLILLKMNYSYQIILLVSIVPGIISMVPIIFLTTDIQKSFHNRHTEGFVKDVMNLPQHFLVFVIIILLFGCANFNKALLLYRVQSLLSDQSSFSIFATTWSVGLYFIFNLVRGLSEFFIGALSDYIDRKLLLALIGFGVFSVASICCLATTTAWWFWVFVFGCAGLSTGTVKVLERAHASYILPEDIRGIGLGLLQAVSGVGDIVSSVVVGLLWTLISPSAAFGYAAVMSCLAMIILLLKNNES